MVCDVHGVRVSAAYGIGSVRVRVCAPCVSDLCGVSVPLCGVACVMWGSVCCVCVCVLWGGGKWDTPWGKS